MKMLATLMPACVLFATETVTVTSWKSPSGRSVRFAGETEMFSSGEKAKNARLEMLPPVATARKLVTFVVPGITLVESCVMADPFESRNRTEPSA